VRRGIILDRDGTLIDVVRDEETGAVTTAFHPSHLRLLPGVVEGLRELSAAGHVLAVATNQPGPAKGHFSPGAVQRTNDALVALLRERGVEIARVAVCLHHPEGGPGGDPSLVRPCDCRKPEPGMLTRLVEELGLSPGDSWMVGDSRADVEAGQRAGLKTALLLAPDRCELCPHRGGPALDGRRPDLCVSDLSHLARAVLAPGSAPCP